MAFHHYHHSTFHHTNITHPAHPLNPIHRVGRSHGNVYNKTNDSVYHTSREVPIDSSSNMGDYGGVIAVLVISLIILVLIMYTLDK